MKTDKHTKPTEDKPAAIHPDATHLEHPAKQIKAQEKVDIKESGFGREQGQSPAEEHLESFSQIDDADASAAPEEPAGESPDGFRKTINSPDERDLDDSLTDWDAQNNRSGRHK